MDIAAEFGVVRSAVDYHRAKLGLTTPRKRIDWTGIDWKFKTCEQIAKELGVAAGVVRNKRSRLFGALRAYDWTDVDWNLSNQEIAALKGANVDTVVKQRRTTLERVLANPKLSLRLAVDWDAVDWSKSDACIAREVRRHRRTVELRRALKFPKANLVEA